MQTAETRRHFTVLFRRNPAFVGREDDLERMHAILKAERPVGILTAGLTGMGGRWLSNTPTSIATTTRAGSSGSTPPSPCTKALLLWELPLMMRLYRSL